MNKILVTGGMGYIGSNLCNYLNDRDISVIIYDKKDGWCATKTIDLSNVDAVVHLAAISGINKCKDNLQECIVDNISSAFHIFGLAYREGKRVVFTSSQAAKNPESSVYAMCKYICEIEAIRLNNRGGDIKVLRLANVYGGNNFFENKTTAIANFVNIYKGSPSYPLIINGDGKQTRDFIHIQDICDAIYKCLIHDDKINEPLDIGTGIQTSVLDIAKMFDGYPHMFDDKIDGGIYRNIVDTTKAKKLLGFKAMRRIEDYIKDFIVPVR